MRPRFSVRHIHGITFAILLAAIGDASAQGFKFLEVKVVDPDGQPMADVAVEISLNGMSFPMPTDEKGMVAVNVPAGEEGELELSVQHPGYMAQGARWGKGNKTPEEFTIPMKKGNVIGGIVHDEAGQPVVGVKIEATVTGFDRYGMNSGKGELQPSLSGEIAVTDAEGHWMTDMAPESNVGLQLKFSHSDYISDRGYSFRGGTWEELLARKNIVVLEKGITIAGKVTDLRGKPIPGANVSIGVRSRRIEVTTDERGAYNISNMPDANVVLTVAAAGFSPDQRTVAVTKGLPPTDFQLGPGHTVRLRVVDEHDEPLAGVRVIPDEWRGTVSLEVAEMLTDEDGRWEWNEAPADEIQYIIGKSGRMGVVTKLKPADAEYAVTVHPAVGVNCTVIDKETREPIESFKFVEGVWWEPSYDRYVLQSHNVQDGKNGKFRLQMGSACHKFCVRVEAEEYKPLVSREIMPDEGEIEITFELEKGQGPQGVVVSLDGQPVEGAEVALATVQQGVYLNEGTFQDSPVDMLVTTDEKGQFSLPFADGKFAIVVIHDSGWAEHDGDDLDETLELTLSPWSTITGVSLRGAEPVAGETILFHIQRPYDPQTPHLHWSYQTETSATGAFEFRRVKSGPITVQRYIPYAITGRDSWNSVYSHGTQIDVKPRETTHVQIGGEGRHLKGKLKVAEEDASAIDWNMACVQLTRKKSEVPKSGMPESYGCAIAQDGTFEIFDVAPGTYDMHVMVYPEGAATTGWTQVADLRTTCEVPDVEGDDTVDLGTFTVPLIKPQE